MKILIAYDGSKCADAALDDLKRAGLPIEAEALVLVAAEVNSPLKKAMSAAAPGYHFLSESRDDDAFAQAKALAVSTADRIGSEFPDWKVDSEALADSAEAAISRRSRCWKPDLIVMGSHGFSGFKRFVLGSVAQHVLNHTHSSVRICRCRSVSNRTTRIVIATDGSSHSKEAVKSVAGRHWPDKTEARIVSVVDTGAWLLTAAAAVPESMCVPAIQDELDRRANEAVQEAITILKPSGLQLIPRIIPGNSAAALVSEAQKFDADCIFLGARGLGSGRRLCLGSVSNFVALNAHCSVEVVRN